MNSDEEKFITITDLGKSGIKRNYLVILNYENNITKVIKRFNEFQLFYNYLIGKYPFEIFPILPEKDLKNKFQSFFSLNKSAIYYNRIERSLNSFFNYLISNTKNERIHSDIRDFLEGKVITY